MDEQMILKAALFTLPLLIALIFHEFAHGFVALLWGDTTAKEQGRLTLNPIPHIDPVGTLLLPAGLALMGSPVMFGWAKPVPINPSKFKSFRPGLFTVALAGPAMNILLALVSAFGFWCAVFFLPKDFYLYTPIQEVAKVSVILNFALALFNLLPIPPLDGSKMVQSFLSLRNIVRYEQIGKFFAILMIIAMFTGSFKYISGPIFVLYNQTMLTVGTFFHALFGVPA